MVKAIGLNSGSSFDGVDAVLIDLANGPIYAEAARALMRKCSLAPGNVEVIGFKDAMKFATLAQSTLHRSPTTSPPRAARRVAP